MFLSKTKASILHYRNELQNIKKGGMSMSEYLFKFKGLVDTLSYAGHIISEENQILQVLNGLGIEYNPIMTTITIKLSSYTVQEVTSLLLTVEKNLDQHSHASDSFSANYVVRPQNNSGYSRRNFKGGHANVRGGYNNFDGRNNYRGNNSRFRGKKAG